MKYLRWLLFPFALVMICITECRNFFFRQGWFTQHKFSFPVIVIGNLSIGGTGKSPMVDYILKLFSGITTASLSRGYGRNTKGFIEVLPDSAVTTVGDEPLMIKLHNSNAVVAVDEDRVHGIQEIKRLHPLVQCMVLDDAFQHRRVKPGLSILLTTWHQPFYNDFILPVGNLRELRKNAARADVVIITKCPVLSPEQKQETLKAIASYTSARVFFSELEYGKPLSLFGHELMEEDSAILLVTGIADAKPLLAHLQQEGKQVKHLEFPDHYHYKTSDFRAIAENFNSFATQKKVVLTTRKDAVKWLQADADGLLVLRQIPVFYQPVQMVIQDNPEVFNEILLRYAQSNQRNS